MGCFITRTGNHAARRALCVIIGTPPLYHCAATAFSFASRRVNSHAYQERHTVKKRPRSRESQTDSFVLFFFPFLLWPPYHLYNSEDVSYMNTFGLMSSMLFSQGGILLLRSILRNNKRERGYQDIIIWREPETIGRHQLATAICFIMLLKIAYLKRRATLLDFLPPVLLIGLLPPLSLETIFF